MKLQNIWLNLVVEPDNLVQALVFNLSYEEVIDFIMALEADIADSVFTEGLLERVKEALEAFGEVDDDVYIE